MSYQRGIHPSQPPPAEINSFACVAHDCPLPGVFRVKMTGPSPSICRAHAGTQGHEWPLITERVKRIERAMYAAIDMTNACAGDEPDRHLVAKFVAMSPDLAPSGKPTARTYGAFVLGKLIEKVRPKEQHQTAPDMSAALRKLEVDIVV